MIVGLVSTIVPVFNRPLQLRHAVESVLAQDYHPLEVIIVDDGSTDDTPAAARALAAAYPDVVHVLTQENAGPGAARERGRLSAQGEFIQYLDSDDVLLPGKFRVQVTLLRNDEAAVAAYGLTCLRDRQGRLLKAAHKRTGERLVTMFPAFLVSRWWETATPLYRSSITDLAGPWTNLRLEEDWEYDCRIAALGGTLAWTSQPVSEHRDHGGQRLSRGPALDPERMRQRARSHALIFEHAQRAGIGVEAPEMRHFSRELFLLARQCGAAGLADESQELFDLARLASGARRARGLDFSAYRTLAAVFGWRAAGRASQWLDNVRNGRPA